MGEVPKAEGAEEGLVDREIDVGPGVIGGERDRPEAGGQEGELLLGSGALLTRQGFLALGRGFPRERRGAGRRCREIDRGDVGRWGGGRRYGKLGLVFFGIGGSRLF